MKHESFKELDGLRRGQLVVVLGELHGDAGEGLGGLDDVVDPGQLPGNLGHLVLVENVDGSTVDDQLKI